LTPHLGESGAGLLYIAVILAAFLALIGAAGWTGVGPAVIVAFGLSTLAVGLLRWLDGQNVDIGD
jgi:hypothetical protein